MGKLKVGMVYDWIRHMALVKPWGKLIWATSMTPQHSFVLWMAAMERMHTMDRMEYLELDDTCVLCDVQMENGKHLFFQCSVSSEVWDGICVRMGIARRPTTLKAALKWLKKEVWGNSYRSKAKRCALASLVYHLWEARNKRR
ncbi:PREDICTED: uncharacterized protein LOC105972664 [Erythranthe guttata]|uniref:uncharacterized protein LOC105972664 n=1 Tax=Erythranthe guttata TaxID=4155 RepID=UPI00064DE8DE|nr:PREDICTED: uncharacterized protein LOC105972664 [Erythranthe guttata]|eukprot:XP_012853094.1 PREDICTED: uncharacterized protein LOC105972664 [Erythranthe guttata]